VANPPTGTLTFLFTDIEGSTKLWEQNAQAMRSALARHDELLRHAIEEHGGYIFKTVGDAFCCVFPTAPDALEAALETQRRLLSSEWEQTGPLRVRMALHTGAAEERDGDYFGPPVNRVAKLLSAAHGGQVLLSLPTQELVRDQLPAGTNLAELGEHRLKDLFRPERVFQLLAPGLPSEFPPLSTLESRLNNLPPQPTPLVGRERELGEVRELLLSPEVRLLTLTGPGGTGKTRLALQAGADLLEEFDDGVFFVSLASLTDPELFLPTVATTLGVKESSDRSLEESFKEYLREKELLLLLDNFEQVLEAGPALSGLLSAAPGLKVLATSRIPLGLYGGREYPVPPLSVPDPRRVSRVEALTHYEAVRLFIESARAVKPDFTITNESAPAVAEICVRLDGLPLAIELAAARIRMLPPKALLARLGNRLKLLTGGARDLPERQRTLRGAIEWSYDLLDEGEKVLFGRLSVFSGGRTLEAIEAVCDAKYELPVDAFDGISSLLEKNLLRQEEGPDGEPRFVMLETTHEFAREKLEQSGEAEEIKGLHAQYFLALAEETEPELKGSGERWLEHLEAEQDNFRVALNWALQVGDTDLALRLGGALIFFWDRRGHYGEGRRWLEEALTKEGRVPATVRGKALGCLARMAAQQGDLDQAEAACEEGLELMRSVDDEGFAGVVLRLVLGVVALVRGDPDRAATLTEESLTMGREQEDRWAIAGSMLNLSVIAQDRGDLGQATSLLEESLVLFRELGNKQGISYCLVNLGNVALSRGDAERGAALTEEAVALQHELGAKGELAGTLSLLAWAALLQGEHERSKALYEESLELAREAGLKPIVADCLEGLACVAETVGEESRTARLIGMADALREATAYPRDPTWTADLRPRLAAARSRLGEEGWEEALAEGRAMTLEEAISYGLEEDGTARSACAPGERL
jgi:predicted ATPase/class 3 adenylate cyclase